jgi:sodium/bile acid cotransporter 7
MGFFSTTIRVIGVVLLKGLLGLPLLLILVVPQAIVDGAEPSDARKLDVVYQMYRDYKKNDFPTVKDMTPKEAMDMLKAGRVVFVDTRKPEEMAVSMLPGAVSKEAFLGEPHRFGDKRIVAYCTISYRSGVFAKEMAGKGIRVFNLRGGLLAWVLEGGRVYDQNGETKKIHVYGKKWNYPADGYQSVMFGLLERIL